uniref:COP9 signalosome complex subunit 9 n=1 Tax=Panthera tigris altaica TaxID=74533 RepID=A0A8C9M1A4_PANTA
KAVVDEVFPEGAGLYVDLEEAGGSTGLLMNLAASEKAVHHSLRYVCSRILLKDLFKDIN